MNNQNKIFGVIFIAIGLVNLIRPEWIDFGIFTAIGASLLINPRNSATAKIMQIALTIVAVGLLVTRLVIDFSS